jgi:hypothetical protein
MGTPFVATTLFVLTTLNGAGQLAPIDRSEWPPGGGPIFIGSETGCLIQRGKMANPSRYLCQGFRSSPSAQWMLNNDGAVEPPPPEVDHANVTVPERKSSAEPPKPEPAKEIESKNDVQVGKLTPEVKEPAPKPKQVAKRTADYREQQQAMLDGPNPFRALFNW